MNHLQLALRNLSRRPARSVLTAVGVALAVGSFITLYGLSQSVEQNVGQSIEEHGADLTIRRSGTAELFGGTVPESVGARAAEHLRRPDSSADETNGRLVAIIQRSKRLQ